MSQRGRWAGALAVLVAVRAAIPLAALAASGHRLPGLPHYEYDGLAGDAPGYYAAAREFMAAVPRLGTPLVAVLAAGLLLTWIGLALAVRRRRVAVSWALIGAVAALVLVVTLAVTKMHGTGAGAFGWSLVWSLPMLPLRAAGVLDQDWAFGVGILLSLAANAVTVVAVAYCGLYATGRRWLGLASAAAFAFWPLLTGLVAGSRGWGNGTWQVDAGLAMYTEPLSTALVTVAVALVLMPGAGEGTHVAVGLLLGYATLTRLSNALLAALLIGAILARYGPRRATIVAVAGLVFAPLVVAYWPRGYPSFEGPSAEKPAAVESASDALHNWSESVLFSPRTLLILVPLAAIGAFAIRPPYARFLLAVPIVLNAAVFTVYRYTAEHPRFLFVSLPPLFVLWTTGAGALVARLRNRRLEIRSPTC